MRNEVCVRIYTWWPQQKFTLRSVDIFYNAYAYDNKTHFRKPRHKDLFHRNKYITFSNIDPQSLSCSNKMHFLATYYRIP